MHHISTKHEKMSPSTVLTKTSPTQSPMKNDDEEDTKFHSVQFSDRRATKRKKYDASCEKDVN